MRIFEDPFDILSSARKQIAAARTRLIEKAYEEEPDNASHKYSIAHAFDFSKGEIEELYEFLTLLSTNTDEAIINYLFKENDGQKF